MRMVVKIKKQTILLKIKYYYAQDKTLEDDKDITSAEDWLHGYLFALYDNNIITYNEREKWLKDIKGEKE